MLDACWAEAGFRITEYGVREYVKGSPSGTHGDKRGGVQAVLRCTKAERSGASARQQQAGRQGA